MRNFIFVYIENSNSSNGIGMIVIGKCNKPTRSLKRWKHNSKKETTFKVKSFVEPIFMCDIVRCMWAYSDFHSRIARKLRHTIAHYQIPFQNAHINHLSSTCPFSIEMYLYRSDVLWNRWRETGGVQFPPTNIHLFCLLSFTNNRKNI